MLLELKNSCIYGPVRSRRLGVSLGLNILPWGLKTCPFNCVYCQYGWTDYSWIKESSSLAWPTPEMVEKELRAALAALPRPPAYITFSGNGEATVHPHFFEMVEMAGKVRNEMAPEAKTAILSNSAAVGKAPVRCALDLLDVRIMKLDCGDEETFRWFNKPFSNLQLEEITEGLEKLGKVTIQSLFAGGKSGNINRINLESWLKRILKIRPLHVQIYSLDRDTPDSRLRKASREILEGIRADLEAENISATVYD